jgi:hypothetical protein
MRKPFRAGGVAVGALAAALTAGAFTFAPASTALTTVTSTKVPASIQPGTPVKSVGGAPSAAASAISAIINRKALNWAGYAVTRSTTTFRFVSAQFTVPTVDCTGVTATGGAWSGHWIGLDGFLPTSSTVEQIGVIAGCNDSTSPAVYQAFWEMFPNQANIPSIAIAPGDVINMSVYYNRSTRKFTLTLSDTTSGQSFTRVKACPAHATCRRNSAEAISEAPSDGATGDILPLANFGIGHFANVSVTNTSGTHRGGLQSSFWNTSKITQVAGNGTNFTVAGNAITQGSVLDSPTSLTNKRTFNNQWQPANGA